MYAFYLTAVPEKESEGYDLNKSYPIIFVVNTLSTSYASEKAKKVLEENHWTDINFQYIGTVPENKRGQYSFSDDDPSKDYVLIVFPNAARNKYLQKIISKAKTVLNGFFPFSRKKSQRQ
jgi:hypothetical protein